MACLTKEKYPKGAIKGGEAYRYENSKAGYWNGYFEVLELAAGELEKRFNHIIKSYYCNTKCPNCITMSDYKGVMKIHNCHGHMLVEKQCVADFASLLNGICLGNRHQTPEVSSAGITGLYCCIPPG